MTIITENEAFTIPLNAIVEDPNNIRTVFDEASLQELAQSIKAVGLLNPLVVQRDDLNADTFTLTAGARRFRALQLLVTAGDIPEDQPISCTMSSADAADVTVAMLVENLQREDIAVLDEARGYMRLTATHKLKVKDLASRVGRSVAHINQRLSLLTLNDDVLAAVGHKLSIDTAAKLVKITDTEVREKLAKQAVKGKSVDWEIDTAIRKQTRAEHVAKVEAWASKNLITIEKDLFATAAHKHRDDYTWPAAQYKLADLGKYVPRKGDVVLLHFQDGIDVYSKLTKAEKAARDAQRAEAAANRAASTKPESERTPWDDWDDKHAEFERAFEEYNEKVNEVTGPVIAALPGKTIAKIALEQLVDSEINARPMYLVQHRSSEEIIEGLGLAADDNATVARKAYANASTENALRIMVLRYALTFGVDAPTLKASMQAQLDALGLVEPVEPTDPEPWQDDNGNWVTDIDFADHQALVEMQSEESANGTTIATEDGNVIAEQHHVDAA